MVIEESPRIFHSPGICLLKESGGLGAIHGDALAMEQGAAHGIYGVREAECGSAFKEEGSCG